MKNGLAGRFYVCQVSPARVLQVVHNFSKNVFFPIFNTLPQKSIPPERPS
jgi:hypothetical protein